MRFLTDETFPGAAVDALVRAGHDVVWIGMIAPGMPDTEVFQWAARESRIILTFDKDFGEIAPGYKSSGCLRRGVVSPSYAVIR